MGDAAATSDVVVRRGREGAAAGGSWVMTGWLGSAYGGGGDRGLEVKVVVLVCAPRLTLLLVFPTPVPHSSLG